MASSGTLRCVALVRTDVSEELSTSFIRVTRIGELGTTLAVTSNRRTLRRNTKYSHRSENLKSYRVYSTIRYCTATNVVQFFAYNDFVCLFVCFISNQN
jgi:hypothetical protein